MMSPVVNRIIVPSLNSTVYETHSPHPQIYPCPKQYLIKNVIAGFLEPLTITLMKQYFVYIMTNKYHNVLYTGVTNNLIRRVYEHKQKLVEGFTKRYGLSKLVYYELAETANAAITREKQIKGGSRKDKIDLIQSMNPKWQDLYEKIL
jgi:putative endonuclease